MGETTKEKKQRKKLSGWQIRSIIVASVSVLVGLALIITNFFIPVKYLLSYMVIRNKGAKEGVMRVRFVDVGFGDCIIIELPDGKNMLIDAGDGAPSNQSRILKYLNQCNINTIDYLVCSSVNSEHCGGLFEILEYKKVETVYMPYCTYVSVTEEYRSFSLSLSSRGTKNIISSYGVEIDGDSGYCFKILSPSGYDNSEGEYFALNQNPSSQSARNDASAVCWLQYGQTSFLFTGDVGADPLKKIMEAYNTLGETYIVPLENCTVAQVAYHGGTNSDLAEFYSLINPQSAVISVGNNAFGCPSPDLISSLSGSVIYRTDKNGTVTFEVTKDGYKVV